MFLFYGKSTYIVGSLLVIATAGLIENGGPCAIRTRDQLVKSPPQKTYHIVLINFLVVSPVAIITT